MRLTDQDKKDIRRGQAGRVLLRWRGRLHTTEITWAVKNYKFELLKKSKARRTG